MIRTPDTERQVTLRLDGDSDIPWPEREGSGIGRRIVVAFVLSCLIAAGCWIVLPRFGVWVPVWVPLACFGLIAAAAVFAGHEDEAQHADGGATGAGGGCCKPDDGRPICCSGPRPLRMFKD